MVTPGTWQYEAAVLLGAFWFAVVGLVAWLALALGAAALDRRQLRRWVAHGAWTAALLAVLSWQFAPVRLGMWGEAAVQAGATLCLAALAVLSAARERRARP